jgi:hypothetical protein
VWPRLAKQVGVELEELAQLISAHSALLERCPHEAPNAIESSALAAMLHSFYTGIENSFKRIAVEVDGGLPTGANWHRQLLDAMPKPAPDRPAVISADTHRKLVGYLSFRHLFRHAYTFHLRWEKMATLVLECEDVLQNLQTELQQFLRGGGPPVAGDATRA